MTRTNWTSTLSWTGAAAAALLLAAVAPNDTRVMGRLPSFTAKRLDQRIVTLPQGIPGNRSLALIAFKPGQREEVESWIRGLRLRQDSSIAWFKMPVLSDPGSENGRTVIETALLARHASDGDHARMVPLFTDQDAFIRAAGLSGTDHASVLVIDRKGRVLARAEGQFDEGKARALRETLQGLGS